MITITGATGQLGNSVINFLIQKGVSSSEITALARSVEKAEPLKAKGVNIKTGNYDDLASLVEAFKGTDKLLLISGNEMEKREQQHINVVNAAKEAGVKHIFYTSLQRKTDSADSPIGFVLSAHLNTEKIIQESGMSYTILRNNLYMDMLPWVLGQNVVEAGIFYPAKDGEVAYTMRDDMAEAAANVMMSDGHEGKEYNISNGHSLSFGEVAQHLSAVTGKEVKYISPDVAVYKDTLMNAGMPEVAVDMLAGFAMGASAGELVAGDTDLPGLLGREPVNYKTFLDAIYTQK